MKYLTQGYLDNGLVNRLKLIANKKHKALTKGNTEFNSL